MLRYILFAYDTLDAQSDPPGSYVKAFETMEAAREYFAGTDYPRGRWVHDFRTYGNVVVLDAFTGDHEHLK